MKFFDQVWAPDSLLPFSIKCHAKRTVPDDRTVLVFIEFKWTRLPCLNFIVAMLWRVQPFESPQWSQLFLTRIKHFCPYEMVVMQANYSKHKIWQPCLVGMSQWHRNRDFQVFPFNNFWLINLCLTQVPYLLLWTCFWDLCYAQMYFVLLCQCRINFIKKLKTKVSRADGDNLLALMALHVIKLYLWIHMPPRSNNYVTSAT
jgi:hypothetical protein